MLNLNQSPWTLRSLSDCPEFTRTVDAIVPGCVHLDLLRHGVIDDPYVMDNADACQWIGWCDWEYATHFELEELDGFYELEAEMLQGTAKVLINGTTVATHRSQHLRLSVDVTDALRVGHNELAVRFTAPLAEGAALAETRGHYPVAMPGVQPSTHLRQMACGFGWDWAPPLASVGILTPIALRQTRVARLDTLRADVASATEDLAVVNVAVSVRRADDAAVQCVLELRNPSGAVVAAANGTRATLQVSNPARWWPVGHGDQPLYTLSATLTHAGEVIDRLERRVGLRSITVDRTPDEIGSAFTFVVNGKPIFAKGMNWSPLDQLLPRISSADLKQRVTDAVELGANMLRVWGGGIFEPDAFYDACDEQGVLVWQDFLFACGMYPDRELHAEVQAEARYQVQRLSGRACLAIFCGGNENIWFYHLREEWRNIVGKTGWGEGFYFNLFPSIVGELAPHTAYVANSPFGERNDTPPHDPAHGPQHLWDVWNREPAENYRNVLPRFASEYGFCGPANYATLDDAIGLDGRTPDDPLVVDRLKAVNGQEKLNGRLADVFGPDLDLDIDEWLIGGQLMQAWAVQVGVEWFRANAPVCAGSLLWELNDVWPAVSWSLIDSAGRHKLASHAARVAMADRRLTFQPRDGEVHLVAINDTDRPMQQRATVRQHSFAGETLAECELRIDVPPRSVRWLPVPAMVAQSQDVTRTLLRCGNATWYFAPHQQLQYDAGRFEVDCVAQGSGYDVRVTARTFLRDVCLFPDRLDSDATVDTAMITLLPGEAHTFHVRSDQTLARRQLAQWPVVAAANDFRRLALVAAKVQVG